MKSITEKQKFFLEKHGYNTDGMSAYVAWMIIGKIVNLTDERRDNDEYWEDLREQKLKENENRIKESRQKMGWETEDEKPDSPEDVERTIARDQKPLPWEK